MRESYLGRGQEPIAGKPFGYAHAMERREIEDHLIKRGWSRDDLRFRFRVIRIQERLHKNAPTMAERQAAWKARQPKPAPSRQFTAEELARIAEHFAGANDPIAQAIYAKASR